MFLTYIKHFYLIGPHIKHIYNVSSHSPSHTDEGEAATVGRQTLSLLHSLPRVQNIFCVCTVQSCNKICSKLYTHFLTLDTVRELNLFCSKCTTH